MHKIGTKGEIGMSDYRRLISYIYAYEGGEKKNNTGYAKVEIRADQCRIYVNVKNIHVGKNDLNVYLLASAQEIPLGQIHVHGGIGEFRTSVDRNDVCQSGRTIEECYGLTIHELEYTGVSYTTIWEDAVAQAAEVNTRENALQDSGAEESGANQAAESNKVESQDSQIAESPIVSSESKVLDEIPWNPEPDVMQIPEYSKPTDLEETKNQQEPEKQMEPESERTWHYMQKRYAKVQAFDYEDGCEILMITPQDIGILPRETWIYGNNSFLLHGYYNYRYLILARLENPNGDPRYLLGVPGHSFRPEKNMAALFGFTHFIPAKKQPDNDGRFGYWYAEIM
jgi:hypothetical protein